jgi:nucleotide-binding universal stress UspA family protein
MTIKRIVVATDGSKTAQQAMKWSAEVAGSLGAAITAIYAVGRTYHPAQMASSMYIPVDYLGQEADNPMFEKILVAIDGSPFSDAALAAAAGLARKIGAETDIIHVHEHEIPHSKAVHLAELETSTEAARVIAEATAKLSAQGVTAHGHVLESDTHDVARRISEFADESRSDLIIVGRRGLSTLTGMLVGSVSNKLVHAAHVPVMVAP